ALIQLLNLSALAQDHDSSGMDHDMTMSSPYIRPAGPSDCKEMQLWDVTMGMCMPFPMENMTMKMLMVSGNAFIAGVAQQSPRGRNAIVSPNMFMIDVGTTIGDSHYLNLDWMGTIEKWSFPESGYPELLQIGEANAQGQPYIDAQHPHSSPIMGLTFSDTIRLGDIGKNSIKLFFAPRGETTDGPVAFMHRVTGLANPDAPLGHHIAQDLGHITSTVIGASLKLGNTRFEGSVFNGTEPEPTKVDLPIGAPNSYAFRLVEEFTPKIMAMASIAYVANPEHHEPTVASRMRYSASMYTQNDLSNTWKLYNTLIVGHITNYENANLSSIGEEFLFKGDRPRIWGRIELAQRTPGQLQITGLQNTNQPFWVAALTVGYTYAVAKFHGSELGVGGAAVSNFIPADFSSAYGGTNPWGAKIFLQLGGMGMWNI
ncbi:MAG: hypothetical protein ABI041_06850, partial [Bdellovibrionia bacterium]